MGDWGCVRACECEWFQKSGWAGGGASSPHNDVRIHG